MFNQTKFCKCGCRDCNNTTLLNSWIAENKLYQIFSGCWSNIFNNRTANSGVDRRTVKLESKWKWSDKKNTPTIKKCMDAWNCSSKWVRWRNWKSLKLCLNNRLKRNRTRWHWQTLFQFVKLYPHRAAEARSIEMHGDASHDAWNGSGTDFGASP